MTLPVIPYILRHKADVVAVMNWWFPMAYQAYLARKIKKFNLIGYPLFHTVESWSRRQLVRKMTPIFDGIIANTAHEATFAKDLNV